MRAPSAASSTQPRPHASRCGGGAIRHLGDTDGTARVDRLHLTGQGEEVNDQTDTENTERQKPENPAADLAHVEMLDAAHPAPVAVLRGDAVRSTFPG